MRGLAFDLVCLYFILGNSIDVIIYLKDRIPSALSAPSAPSGVTGFEATEFLLDSIETKGVIFDKLRAGLFKDFLSCKKGVGGTLTYISVLDLSINVDNFKDR